MVVLLLLLLSYYYIPYSVLLHSITPSLLYINLSNSKYAPSERNKKKLKVTILFLIPGLAAASFGIVSLLAHFLPQVLQRALAVVRGSKLIPFFFLPLS